MKKFFLFLSLLLLPAAISEEAPFQNLSQYFDYLPNAVHKNWTPYKANADYEVTVQFKVKKNGEISEPFIVSSTNKNADASVINAVKMGAPYKPLPAKFAGDGVNTQVVLKYMK